MFLAFPPPLPWPPYLLPELGTSLHPSVPTSSTTLSTLLGPLPPLPRGFFTALPAGWQGGRVQPGHVAHGQAWPGDLWPRASLSCTQEALLLTYGWSAQRVCAPPPALPAEGHR